MLLHKYWKFTLYVEVYIGWKQELHGIEGFSRMLYIPGFMVATEI